MVGGVIIQKKNYGLPYFLSGGLMSVGLCFFILADNQVSPNFDKIGKLTLTILKIFLKNHFMALPGENYENIPISDNSPTSLRNENVFCT